MHSDLSGMGRWRIQRLSVNLNQAQLEVLVP